MSTIEKIFSNPKRSRMRTSIRSNVRAALCLAAILSLPFALSAQGITVTGSVVDFSKGTAIAGATIGVKGSSNGAITNANGMFSIHVDKGTDTLDVSSLGYDRLEVALRNRHTLHLALKQNAENLNAVVVVGYGTQKRTDITGSVASPDQKPLQDLPNNNFIQAMEGAVPGLHVSQSSSDAEGNNESIQIRG